MVPCAIRDFLSLTACNTIGHVNNYIYYAYFDTIVNNYLIERGGLNIHSPTSERGLVVGRCGSIFCVLKGVIFSSGTFDDFFILVIAAITVHSNIPMLCK